ncbi:MAG: hypothetical protein AB7F99_04350 [Vicinamibacterales bacterium]
MVLVLAVLLCVPWLTGQTTGPRFFPDDPIQVDDDRALDASGAVEIEGSNGYDFAEHTFFEPGDRRAIRALNINTVGEVPDSSWFTNRIGVREMSSDEIARGPNQLETLNIDGWPIVQEKSSGITPGFRIVDPTGRLYQLKFDPPSNPEMSSGAEVIGAAFYHAFGYNVVQGYIVEFDPSAMTISPKATTVDMSGRERELRPEDVERVLRRAARLPNGKYRALASRFADGRPLGYFKYYGTRPDDPNDIHPHEHRRELRASRVFAAWLNHDDSRGLNSLDMLEQADGRGFVRHYIFDFGSIMGSGSTVPQRPRAGNEYILEWGPALKTLATLGLYVRPWIGVDYPQVARSVGNFEGDFFDPLLWRPEYPNPAFENMRADDAFWAARIVSRFSDEAIAAVVNRAQYSEPGAAEYVTATLIERRDKVIRAWLTGVNPLVDATLADGALTFANAAVDAGVATAPVEYVVTWSRYDNNTGETVGSPVETRSATPRVRAPEAILSAGGYVAASVQTVHPDFPAWSTPVTLYFRPAAGVWQTVGLERLP